METTLDLSIILQQENFDSEAYDALKEAAFATKQSLHRFLEILAEMEGKAESGEGDLSSSALKLGLSYLILGDNRKAAQWLEKAPSGSLKSFHLGLAFREEKDYEASDAHFREAAGSGWDNLECECQRAENRILRGDVEGARRMLDALAADGERSAHWHYTMGRCLYDAGDMEAAIAAFETARSCDDLHPQATFHLANLLHLHGSDERAKRLYQAAQYAPFVHVNVLMNLAVLYEDACIYGNAEECLRRVLAVAPNHPRAQLYLKDVVAARTMFVDEQQLIDTEKRNAVLDIPVSDFELSVRSRNCLKKMNINTLGDLLRTSEVDLLSYKNFGETSLKEIKVMLTQKALVLGQLSHEQNSGAPTPILLNPGLAPELSDRPIASIELSVRARKCIQLLGITSVGELVARSESELMASPNFGETSLTEIKECLTGLGLKLKDG